MYRFRRLDKCSCAITTATKLQNNSIISEISLPFCSQHRPPPSVSSHLWYVFCPYKFCLFQIVSYAFCVCLLSLIWHKAHESPMLLHVSAAALFLSSIPWTLIPWFVYPRTSWRYLGWLQFFTKLCTEPL